MTLCTVCSGEGQVVAVIVEAVVGPAFGKEVIVVCPACKGKGRAQTKLTASDLRALRARSRLPVYRIAAEAGIAPTTLLELLNSHRVLDDDRAVRIASAIERLAGMDYAGLVFESIGRTETIRDGELYLGAIEHEVAGSWLVLYPGSVSHKWRELGERHPTRETAIQALLEAQK